MRAPCACPVGPGRRGGRERHAVRAGAERGGCSSGWEGWSPAFRRGEGRPRVCWSGQCVLCVVCRGQRPLQCVSLCLSWWLSSAGVFRIAGVLVDVGASWCLLRHVEIVFNHSGPGENWGSGFSLICTTVRQTWQLFPCTLPNSASRKLTKNQFKTSIKGWSRDSGELGGSQLKPLLLWP